jgi:hypothetical protein
MSKVIFSVEVDAAKGLDTLDKMRAHLEKVTDELNKAKIGSDKFSETKKQQQELVREIDILERTVSKFGETQKTANQALSEQRHQSEANSETVRENILLIEKYKNDNIALNETIKASREDLQEGVITQQEFNETLTTATERINENKLSIAALNQENKVLQKETMAVDTSMKAQEQTLSRLKKQYAELSAEERNNADVGGVLLRQIKDLDHEVKQNRASIGEHQRSVGDYSKAIKDGSMNLAEMRRALKELSKEPFMDKSPEEVAKVRQEMALLTDAIQKSQGQINAMSQDTIPSLVAGLQGVVASAQLVTGTMSLMGMGDDERMKKLQQRMVALIGVAQALNTVQKMYVQGQIQAAAVTVKNIALKTAAAVKTYALAIAYGAMTVATKKLAVASIILGKAKMTIPIFWLVAAIVALIAIVVTIISYFHVFIGLIKKVGQFFGIVSDETEKAAEKTKSYKEQLQDLAKAKEALIDKMQHELKLMKASGVAIDEIVAAERTLMLEKIKAQKINLKLIALEGVFGEERKKNFEEQMVALRDLQRELEIFDVAETKRQKDNATEASKTALDNRLKAEAELKKYIEAERKAALDLAVLQSMTDDERLEAKKERLRLEFDITTKALNAESEQYKLAAQKLNDDLAKLDAEAKATEKAENEKRFNENLERIEAERRAKVLAIKMEFAEKEAYAEKEAEMQAAIDEANKEAKLLELEEAKLAMENELITKAEHEALLTAIQEEEAENRIKITQKEYEKFRAELEKSVAQSEAFANQLSGILQSSLDETGLNMKKFSKGLLVLLLDTLQKQVIAGIVASTVQSFSNEQTFQALATSALKAGLITVAFQGAKTLLMQEPKGFATGGYTGGGSPSQVAGVVHKQEYVLTSAETSAMGGASGVEAWKQLAIPQANSGMNDMMEAMMSRPTIVTVEEINKVSNQYSNRVEVAEL